MLKCRLSNQIELAYEMQLSTDVNGSPWIILISGLGDTHSVWQGYSKMLNELGFNVLTYDHRDIGESMSVHDDYDLTTLANDLLQLIDHLKINRAHLLGHSMGAMIAQIIAEQQPQRVISLTLIAALSISRTPSLLILEKWVAKFKQQADINTGVESSSHYYNRLSEMFSEAFSENFNSTKQEEFKQAAVLAPRQNYASYARQFAAIQKWKPMVCGHYKAPVLAISGANDAIATADDRTQLEKQYPHMQTTLLPKMKHCLHLEIDTLCQASIKSFLEIQRLPFTHYMNPNNKLSEHNLPQGTYLDILKHVENLLPELLHANEWATVDVDYYPPRVERVWLQYGNLRINLHRIHAGQTSAQTLLHNHPWPSAMRVLGGVYEMGIGYNSINQNPPLAATILLNEGTSYEMVDPNAWHYVNPKTQVSYSLMVSGCPWPERAKKSSLKLGPLSEVAKTEILDFFKMKYPKPKKVAQTSRNGYVFSASEYEAQRLARLNEVYNSNTTKILEEHIKPGMAVLEIGPGTGEIAAWINEHISATGFYAAVDLIDTNFNAIRALNSRAQLIQASVIDTDLTATFKDQKFDVVFCRWVLSYIPQEQRKLVLQKMNNLLKSAGKLIVEEFDLYASNCVSMSDVTAKVECRALDEWKKLSEKVEEKFPLDFSLGRRLNNLVKEANPSSEISVCLSFQGLFKTKRHKQVLSFGMQSAKEAVVGSKLKNVASYDDLISDLEVLENDESLAVQYIEDYTIVAVKQ